MNEKVEHLIQQVTLDLNVDRQDQAFAYQQKMKRVFQDYFVPILDEALSLYCPPGVVLNLDNLEIDLGNIDLENIDESSISNEFRKEIKKLLEKIQPDQILRKDQEENALDIFVYFIKNGILPWQNTFKTITSLETAVAPQVNTSTRFFTLFQNNSFRQRLLTQFSPSFVKRIILSIQPEMDQDWISKEKNHFSPFLNEQVYLAYLLEAVYSGNEIRPLSAIRNQIQSKLENIQQQSNDFQEEDLITSIQQQITETLPTTENTIDGDSIYVENGGIILLHPFLSRFFEKMNLVEGGRFKTEKDQVRAVHMLYYLSTGKIQPEEYELPLLKLLCNWPLNKTITKEIDLPTDFEQYSNELLKALIGHWEKLKNTSIDGLREGFINRQGKLSKVQEQWQLTVDQKTLDVLLDTLPWSISIVKLPWMTTPLWVNWR